MKNVAHFNWPLVILIKPKSIFACVSLLYNVTNLQPSVFNIRPTVMLLSFGACIAVEFVLFVFANDFGQNNNEISAILQKLKTLEEEVSTLKQGLKSCQSGRNEFSKSSTEISEYKLWSLSKPATCFVRMFTW